MQVAGLIACTVPSGLSPITSRRVSPIRNLESRSFLAGTKSLSYEIHVATRSCSAARSKSLGHLQPSGNTDRSHPLQDLNLLSNL